MAYIAILIMGGSLNLILYRGRIPRSFDNSTAEQRARALRIAFIMGAITYGGLGSILFALF